MEPGPKRWLRARASTGLVAHAIPALLFAAWLVCRPAALYAAPFAYVTNVGDNTVSVVDTVSNTLVASVPVGDRPVGVAVNGAGTRVYVTNAGSNSLSIVDTTTNTVSASVSIVFPSQVALDPTGARAYVTHANASLTAGFVSVLDTASNVVTDTVAVGLNPFGVAVSRDGSRVYVANTIDKSEFCGGRPECILTVSVIDTETNTVVGSPGIGPLLRSLALNRAGTRMYASGAVLSVIDVTLDPNVLPVIAMIPVGTNDVAVDPTGARVYATNGHGVSVIDTEATAVVATIETGSLVSAVAVHPNGSRVYVTDGYNNSLSVIDTATNAVVSTLAVGNGPTDIAIGPEVIGSPKPTPTVTPTQTAMPPRNDGGGCNLSPSGGSTSLGGPLLIMATLLLSVILKPGSPRRGEVYLKNRWNAGGSA